MGLFGIFKKNKENVVDANEAMKEVYDTTLKI